jgi:GDPmannose 4,6-dehydratase
VAAISLGLQEKLYLGNMDAKRDWWHAKDYIEGMWLMLQQDIPEEYVLASGQTYSVRYFVEESFKVVWIHIIWKWEGIEEKWYDSSTWECLVEVDPRYFRPAEVDVLLWDSTKAKENFWWTLHYTLDMMVKDMVESDLKECAKQKILKDHWY